MIPGLGRSPGEGKGYPLQYSRLEKSVDCVVHGVAKSQTRLSDFHFTLLHWEKKEVRGEFILPDLKYSTVFPSSHTPTPATTILLLKKSSVAKFNSFSSQFHIYRREIILALWFMMCYWTSIYVKLMFQKAPVLNGICN